MEDAEPLHSAPTSRRIGMCIGSTEYTCTELVGFIMPVHDTIMYRGADPAVFRSMAC